MSLPLIDVHYPISICVSAYVYMDMYVQVQMHLCTWLCEGQKLMSCVLLLRSLTDWRQDLLMNLELTYPARLSGQHAPVILLSPSVHCWNSSSECKGPNSDPHIWVASTLLTKPSPHPSISLF